MNHLEKNISGLAKQLTEKNLIGFNLKKLSGAHPDGIVIVGIGGSALVGDVLKGIQEEIGLNLPIVVWKDYGIPKHWFKRPLYVFISFSGNTEEPLSGFTALVKKGEKRLAAVSSGGKLKDWSLAGQIPLVSFSAGNLTPRQTTGIMFYGLTKILKAAGLKIKTNDLSKEIKASYFRKEGKKIASNLKNKTVVIYTDEPHRHLGYIWKIKLNETAKNPAFNNVLPEMDHNEITGFDGQKFDGAAIFIESTSSPRMKKRFELTEKLLKERGIRTIKLKLSGKTEVEKTWNMLVLADWTSYFLAKLNGVPEEEFNIINPKIVIALKRLMG
ncbi:MAG: SIS domain-containing protein [bacterium]|nr:SIS domain-containing protein [bacterium]